MTARADAHHDNGRRRTRPRGGPPARCKAGGCGVTDARQRGDTQDDGEGHIDTSPILRAGREAGGASHGMGNPASRLVATWFRHWRGCHAGTDARVRRRLEWQVDREETTAHSSMESRAYRAATAVPEKVKHAILRPQRLRKS